MGEQGAVSLFLGTAASAGAFWSAVEVQYSEDGDFLGSRFSRAFGIDFFDEDYHEAEFYDEPPESLAGFLAGASYDSSIIPLFDKYGVKPSANDNC